MGQSILPQQKSCSLLPHRPRNAIPESIASHSSLFPSLSFSLSLSLSLWPISGDSGSCRKRPKSRRRGSQLLKRLQILNTRVDRLIFSSQHVTLYTKNKIPLLKLIFVLLIYYLKYHNSSTYITIGDLSKGGDTTIYIYIRIIQPSYHTHTHTHTNIYIYIYIYIKSAMVETNYIYVI